MRTPIIVTPELTAVMGEAPDGRPDEPQLLAWAKTVVTREAAIQWQYAPDDAVGYARYSTTWHHNIPWNLLRDSWNIIVTFCHNDVVKRLLTLYYTAHTLGAYVYDDGMKLINKIMRMKDSLGMSARNVGHSPSVKWITRFADRVRANLVPGLTYDEKDLLHGMICWQGYNIVEGPLSNVRIDDPGDQFDDFRMTCAINSRNLARFSTIWAFYRVLQEITLQGEVEYVRAEAITGWNERLTAALNTMEPYRATGMIRLTNDTQTMWIFRNDRVTNDPIQPITTNGMRVHAMRRNRNLHRGF